MKITIVSSLVACALSVPALARAQDSKPQGAAKPQGTVSLPYAAVRNPEFISAAAATFMNAEDRVIGVTGGPKPKAYPAGILAQHGLVQDGSPDGPIAVTW